MYSSSPTFLVLQNLSNPVSKQHNSRGHCISPMISFVLFLMSCSMFGLLPYAGAWSTESSSEMPLSNALYWLKCELVKGSP
jgi:hypothetical protein